MTWRTRLHTSSSLAVVSCPTPPVAPATSTVLPGSCWRSEDRSRRSYSMRATSQKPCSVLCLPLLHILPASSGAWWVACTLRSQCWRSRPSWPVLEPALCLLLELPIAERVLGQTYDGAEVRDCTGAASTSVKCLRHL